MNDTSDIHISVGSSVEYEDFVAEITFGKYFGLIISQEKGAGIYELTAHSLTEDGVVDYHFGKNPSEGKISLKVFLDAVHEATSRLDALQKSEK